MIFKKIAILTSKKSWFLPFAKIFKDFSKQKGYSVKIFHNPDQISSNFKIVFILSYFKVIKPKELKRHQHNLVVHESNLPKGKGWSPLFWQILEGKNKIPIVLFEAVEKIDAGDIYLKDYIELSGRELHQEIRKKQAQITLKLCWRFLKNYSKIKPKRQKPKKDNIYPKRTPIDSELNIDKNLRSQFNLLRIVNNQDFPAFFIHKGKKYVITINEEKKYEI